MGVSDADDPERRWRRGVALWIAGLLTPLARAKARYLKPWGEADAEPTAEKGPACPTARRRRLSITPLGVLDKEPENPFRRWHPTFRPEGQPAKKAA
jgi:hypothetical protein